MRRRTEERVRKLIREEVAEAASRKTLAGEVVLIEFKGELRANKLNNDGMSLTSYSFLTERDVERIVDERLNAGLAPKGDGITDDTAAIRHSRSGIKATLDIHPAPGMSEAALGKIAADQVEFDLIRRSLLARTEKLRRDVDHPSGHTVASVTVQLLAIVLASGLGFYLGMTLPWYSALPTALLAGYGLGTVGDQVGRHLRKAVTR